ncbi:MAG: (2Fe-2S)-binding protein, partial [Pseudomonadota bacterium]|nr:(2Fe-2S)-binding protein [Pseudomonadota bacterium]
QSPLIRKKTEIMGVPPTVNPKLSRRRFIKGVIYSSAAAASGAGYYLASAQTNSNAVMERLLSLNINGQTRLVDVSPAETLAFTLRNKLALTGLKVACNRGECGACTVLLDDVANYSCSLLTHTIKDRAITTIEGLRTADGQLSAVQQGFIEELAPQCGFCTPGQVMSATALLISNPNPTREDARQALAGNLCRCGAYDHYLNGVMRASELLS